MRRFRRETIQRSASDGPSPPAPLPVRGRGVTPDPLRGYSPSPLEGEGAGGGGLWLNTNLAAFQILVTKFRLPSTRGLDTLVSLPGDELVASVKRRPSVPYP